MKLNKNLLFILSASLLIMTQTAHADFRKALEAYQARDGATMLKEVKDAVDKKNDDGLMLLLMATNMDAATSDYDETTKQSKSTLRVILPPPMWDEMRELLLQATNNSSVDTQYYFLTVSQFRADSIVKTVSEYATKGSRLAMLQSTLTNKAEAGNLEAQLVLGFRHLNYDNEYGCEKQSKGPLCQTKDEAKGYYWLKRAVKTYEMSGNADFDLLPSAMCEFYRKTANGDQEKLKQAYLWALKGINEVGSISNSRNCLRKMHDTGELKIAAPEVYAVYTTLSNKSKFDSLIYSPNLKELPDWIVEVRKEVVKEKLPLFTYHFGPEIDVYADGRVLFGLANYPKDMLMKVKPKVVRAFLSELKKIGFYEWTSANFSAGHCPDFDPCGMMDMHLSLRDGVHIKRFYLGLLNEKSQTLDWKYTNRKRMATIKSLAEKYFPTQKLRCGLGNSEVRRKTCVEFDTNWLKIAENGE